MLHEHILHFGTDKLYYYSKENMLIKNPYREARETEASCIQCIKTKYYNKPTEGQQYIDLPTDTNHMIPVDIFGPLASQTFGYKYIIAMTDTFFKAIHLFRSKRVIAKTILNIIEKYFKCNDALTIMVLDGEKHFDSDAWEKLCRIYKRITRFTSPTITNQIQLKDFWKS